MLTISPQHLPCAVAIAKPPQKFAELIGGLRVAVKLRAKMGVQPWP
jgi:hypothetical protein